MSVHRKTTQIAWVAAICLLAATTHLLPAAEKPAKAKIVLPPAAEQAVMALFPKATITGVERESENGAKYYEVDLRLENGTRLEAEVTEEGVIGEVEGREQIDRLDKDTSTAITAATEGGRILAIERHDVHGVPKAGKFVALEKAKLLYEIKYVLKEKKHSLVLRDVSPPDARTRVFIASKDDDDDDGDDDDDDDDDDDEEDDD